ncbi:hypothetical protein H5410_046271 [Solanum commersonii]|uniref:Uncharacterized protein n=1 Tax=Solanum commersonii TaxID=4109 RepID=A0A9J5XDW4_SOLCO|nr:hypothetical protein H5410_046271 [Solanum commersonii]
MPHFELRDYIKDLGYTTTCTFRIKPPDSGILKDIDNDMDILDLCCSLEDGDIVEIYVKHLIDEAVVDPDLILLENISHEDREESGSTFNKRAEPNSGPNNVVGDETLSGEDPFTTTPQTTAATAARTSSTSTPINTTNPTTIDHANPTNVDPNDRDVGPVGSDLVEEDGFDYSTEESVDIEGELVGDDDEDYCSDMHEEVRELRAEKRTFQRRKRNERVQADTEEVPVGEAGPDLGFDDTETGKISVEGRLRSDEPYYPSSDADSFDSGRVNLLRRLGMVFSDVNEFRRVVTKYVVQRRVQVKKWVNEPKELEMCARHILANWAKDWRGLQRRQQSRGLPKVLLSIN